MTEEIRTKIKNLPCWSEAVDPQPLQGGITNFNFTVQDQGRKFEVSVPGHEGRLPAQGNHVESGL